MILNITARNFDLSPSLEAIIEEKLQILNEFIPKNQSVQVTLERHQNYEKVDVMFNWNGIFIKEERESNNFLRSLNIVVNKLKKKLQRFAYKRSKRDTEAHENWGTKYPLYIEEEEKEPIVIKRKQFNMKPMMEEEAILQMELLGHSFFMFLNGETNKMCLLYKRKDGNYGLIESIH